MMSSAEDRIKHLIGEILVAKCLADAEIERLRARLRQYEPDTPDMATVGRHNGRPEEVAME